MKSTLIFKVLFLYLTLTIISCLKPPCNCEPIPFPSIRVKIVNQQGQNLLFGANALYNPDSIKVSEQRNNVSPNAFVYHLISDSTLRINFNKPSEKSYIYYNQQTLQDSLEIQWISKTGRCCGEKYTFYEMETLKFNSASITPVNGILHFIK